MKKLASIILSFIMLLGICGCTSLNDSGSSANSSDTFSVLPRSAAQDNSDYSESQPTTPPTTSFEEDLPPTQEEKLPTSTPNEAYLYKDGVKYRITDPAQTLEITKIIEGWYADTESIPSTSLAVRPSDINDIKRHDTAIELIYDNHCQLVTLTGNHDNLLFGAGSNRVYGSGPRMAYSADFAEILPRLKIEIYTEPPYTSTVAIPIEAYLYKNGIKQKLTDLSQIEQISKEVESWYANVAELPIGRYAAKADDVDNSKKNEVVIELIYDQPILWNGKCAVTDKMRYLLIPITGFENGYVYYSTDGIYHDNMLAGQNYKLESIINDLKF